MFNVLPSPRLISVSHGRAVLLSRGRRSPAVRSVSSYTPTSDVLSHLRRSLYCSPCRATTGCASGVWCHITPQPSDILLPPVWPLSSLVEGRLAFVRYQSIPTGNDDYIVMMSPFSRCCRLPHATPPFLGEDKASLWFVSRLRMVSAPPLVSSRPCPRRSHEKYKISAQLEMSMYSCRGALHGSPPSSSITVWIRDQRECLATQADI